MNDKSIIKRPEDLKVLILSFVLVIGLIFTLIIAAHRNIYDDELTSASRMVEPMPKIIKRANSGDVHPPGMYVLSRLGYLITISIRWTTVLPLLIWFGGLATFLYYTSPLIQSTPLYAFFAIICTFHPHLLMWTNSIRWYPYWSGIALMVISLLLLKDQSSTNNPRLFCWKDILVLGVGLAALFYISYLTLVLGFWLVVSILVYYPFHKRNIRRIFSSLLVSGLLSIPQLIPLFNVHLQNSSSQTFSLYKSTFKLLYGLSIGEAVLPWHPLSIAVTLIVVLPCVIALVWYSRKYLISQNQNVEKKYLKIASIEVLLVGMVLTGAVSGLGWKPRSFLVLVPLVVLLLILGSQEIKNSTWQIVAILLVVLLIVQGGYNIYTKSGTAKGGINDPLEKVVDTIYKSVNDDKAIIFTHHLALSFYLNKFRAKKGLEWETISVYEEKLDSLPPGPPPHIPNPEKIVFVESFIGSLKNKEDKLRKTQEKVLASLSHLNTIKMGETDGEKWKEKLSGMDLPTYRFILYIGTYSEPRSQLKPLIDKFTSF